MSYPLSKNLQWNRTFLSILCICFIVSCASTPDSPSITSPSGSANIAGEYAIYGMMAAESYHDNNRIRFPLTLAGWQQVDLDGNPTTEPTEDSHWFTGLAYDIFEHQNTDEVVISIRGTDSKWDWLVSNFAVIISPAYKQASKEVREYINSHPDKKIKITGHSLGGGIALSVSARLGLDAITFDPSPRIFDGLGDEHKEANRILIFQNGEILEKAREAWPKIFEVVPQERIYSYSFEFNDENNHRGDCLAYGLLKLGATVNPELEPILKNTNSTNKSRCMGL